MEKYTRIMGKTGGTETKINKEGGKIQSCKTYEKIRLSEKEIFQNDSPVKPVPAFRYGSLNDTILSFFLFSCCLSKVFCHVCSIYVITHHTSLGFLLHSQLTGKHNIIHITLFPFSAFLFFEPQSQPFTIRRFVQTLRYFYARDFQTDAFH